MKKLIALFLGLTILSCSSDDQVNQDAVSKKETLASVLDGKMLSFKNEESFIKEYSDLSLLSSDELKSWGTSKKLVSLLSTTNTSEGIEEDVVPESRLVYSDALKTIFNSEYKVKIADTIIWLNELTFYKLSNEDENKSSDELLKVKNDLEVYGHISTLPNQNSTGKNVIPNENRVKTFSSSEMNLNGSRLRHVVDLFNETIYINDVLQTSKMYLRSILQYRSCSTWRCTWKEASNLRSLTSDFYCPVCLNGENSPWGLYGNINTTSAVSGTQTYLIANWHLVYPLQPQYQYPNFVVSGPVNCYISGATGNGVINISWY